MQKIFTTFKAPVNSFPLGEMNVGILKPGRYNGFNAMSGLGTLSIDIKHDGPNEVMKTDLDTELLYFGSLMMPSGSIVHETETIKFRINSNAGNLNPRIDYLVCEHVYVQVVGGEPAQYLVISGPNDGTEPTLPNPEKQVLIGKVTIAPEGTSYDDLTYEKAKVPLLGDLTPEELANLLIDLIIAYATDTVPGIVRLATLLEVTNRANLDVALTLQNIVNLNAEELKKGLAALASEQEIIAGLDTEKIVVPKWLRQWGQLRDPIYHDTGNIVLTDAWNSKTIILTGNYAVTPLVTITVPTGLSNNFWFEVISYTQKVRLITASGVTMALPPSKSAETEYFNQRIELTKLSISPLEQFAAFGDLKNNAPQREIPKNGAIPYFPAGNVLTEFDGTGLGISGDVVGWAICNGANNTRDLRGRFLIHIDSLDARYDTVGEIGGEKAVILSEAEMPRHNHDWKYGIEGDDGSSGGSYDEFTKIPGNIPAADVTNPIGLTGDNQAHNNLPPFYSTIYIQRIV